MQPNQTFVALPNYEIIRVIGSGSFGYVFEAWDPTNKRRVALKRVEKVGTQLSREYEILFELKDCENVVQILDFFYSKTDNGKLIQNIVFEYMSDNLESMIGNYKKQKKFFSEKQIKLYTYQILKGLQFCHGKNIAHRDLKPENVLINDDEKVKICDFGSSKVIDPYGKNTPYIVSRYYRAPELILCISKYDTSIDIWATACIMAELALREPIFQGKSEGDQLFAIFRTLGSPTSEQFQEFSKIVPFDPKIFNDFKTFSRPNISADFCNSIKDTENFLDLMYKMFEYVPSKRISASEALKHPFFKELGDKMLLE